MIPWTVAGQALRPMEFSRQGYWSGLPFPPPGDPPHPGIEPMSLVSSALAREFFITSATWEALHLSWKWKSLSHVWLFLTPWTVAWQAPLYMGFSRQEYWRGLLLPPSGDLPDPRIKDVSSVSPVIQVYFYCWTTREAVYCPWVHFIEHFAKFWQKCTH